MIICPAGSLYFVIRYNLYAAKYDFLFFTLTTSTSPISAQCGANLLLLVDSYHVLLFHNIAKYQPLHILSMILLGCFQVFL